MYSVGDKIVYGESGVCTVEAVSPHEAGEDRLYYHLRPLVGSGMYFSPVDSGAFMRPVMSREEAESFVATIPGIEPAVCSDSRFNHVDAYYRELFKQHTSEALVAVIKGMKIRIAEKKSRSSRADMTIKRAKDMLYGELSVALGIEIGEVEQYIEEKNGVTIYGEE